MVERAKLNWTLSRTVAACMVHRSSRPILCLGVNPPPPPPRCISTCFCRCHRLGRHSWPHLAPWSVWLSQHRRANTPRQLVPIQVPEILETGSADTYHAVDHGAVCDVSFGRKLSRSLLASEPIIKQHYQTVKTLFSGTDHWCLVDQDEVKRETVYVFKNGRQASPRFDYRQKNEVTTALATGVLFCDGLLHGATKQGPSSRDHITCLAPRGAL